MKRVFLLLCFMGCLPALMLAQTNYYNPESSSNRSMRDLLLDLQHDVGNHETEIRVFEERLTTQEDIIDSMRDQILDANLAHQEIVKGSSASIEARVGGLESMLNGAVKDLRQMQTHSNETAKSLKQYKQKISDLEKQIDQLHSAMNSLVDALQMPQEKVNPTDVYIVQSGDSLQKIALRNKTTVSKLKEMNRLKDDRIFAGQKLKLPSK